MKKEFWGVHFTSDVSEAPKMEFIRYSRTTLTGDMQVTLIMACWCLKAKLNESGLRG